MIHHVFDKGQEKEYVETRNDPDRKGRRQVTTKGVDEQSREERHEEPLENDPQPNSPVLQIRRNCLRRSVKPVRPSVKASWAPRISSIVGKPESSIRASKPRRRPTS